MECGLAQSLFQARKHEVMTFADVMNHRTALWVAEGFCEAKRRQIPETVNAPLRAAFATATDNEAFRNGSNFQYGFADVPDEEFHAAQEAVRDFIAKAVEAKEVRIGRNLNVVSFPLGHDPGRQVPLRKGCWIDQRLLKLIFFWQMVREQQVVALPAIDPNPGAFERVFAASTVWPHDSVEGIVDLPAELDDKQIEELQCEAHTYVEGLKLERKKIDGMPHCKIGEVARGQDPYFKTVINLGGSQQTR